MRGTKRRAPQADRKCSFVARGSPRNKSQQKSISSLVTRRQRHSKGVKENSGNGRILVYFSPKRVAAPVRSITARQTMKFTRGAWTNMFLMFPSPRTRRYNNRGSGNVHTRGAPVPPSHAPTTRPVFLFPPVGSCAAVESSCLRPAGRPPPPLWKKWFTVSQALEQGTSRESKQ